MIGKGENDKPKNGLPSLLGTYALVLRVSGCPEIAVGKLGVLAAQPGFYVYVGSALGPGGLAARVGTHYRHAKRLRWHVDYLRAVATDRRSVVCDGEEPPGVPVGQCVTQAAGGVRAPDGIRDLGLRLPVPSVLLYFAAVLGRISEEAAQPEDRAVTSGRCPGRYVRCCCVCSTVAA